MSNSSWRDADRAASAKETVTTAWQARSEPGTHVLTSIRTSMRCQDANRVASTQETVTAECEAFSLARTP